MADDHELSEKCAIHQPLGVEPGDILTLSKFNPMMSDITRTSIIFLSVVHFLAFLVDVLAWQNVCPVILFALIIVIVSEFEETIATGAFHEGFGAVGSRWIFDALINCRFEGFVDYFHSFGVVVCVVLVVGNFIITFWTSVVDDTGK